jgi:hypothetical protein
VTRSRSPGLVSTSRTTCGPAPSDRWPFPGRRSW